MSFVTCIKKKPSHVGNDHLILTGGLCSVLCERSKQQDSAYSPLKEFLLGLKAGTCLQKITEVYMPSPTDTSGTILLIHRTSQFCIQMHF